MSIGRQQDSQQMVKVLIRAINNESDGDDTVLGYRQHTEEALQPSFVRRLRSQ